jgi:hypothetical protein
MTLRAFFDPHPKGLKACVDNQSTVEQVSQAAVQRYGSLLLTLSAY